MDDLAGSRFLGDGKNFFGSTVFLIAALTVSSSVNAEFDAVGPLEVSWLRQMTVLSADWSTTDIYDLNAPVELQVTVEGLLLPEGGHAELLFTPADVGIEPFVRFPQLGPVYHATLQLADEARRLGLTHRSIRVGSQALIKGWPATERNISPSILLVDEISFIGQSIIALHDYPEMQLEIAWRLEQAADNGADD